MKNRVCRTFIFLIIFLSSCQNFGGSTPETSSMVEASPINTSLPTSVKTATPEMPTKTIVPTGTPTPTEIPVNEDVIELHNELGLSGVLWVISKSSSGRFKKISFDQGTIKKIYRPNCDLCYPSINPQSSEGTLKNYDNSYCVGFLPTTDMIICKGLDKYYLEDMLSEDRIDVTKNDLEWFRWSSNGRYIYFPQRVLDTNRWKIMKFDVITKQTEEFIQYNQEDHLDWMENSAISSGGDNIAVIGNLNSYNHVVLKLDSSKTEFEKLWDGKGELSYGLEWSPREPMLVFSVVDYEFEIYPSPPNVLYLADLRTETVEELARLELGEYWYRAESWANIWSPDGEKIALPKIQGGEICVIEVEDKSQECYQVINENESIYSYVWSPASNAIAFISSEEILYVFSLKTNKVYDLLDNVYIGNSVYWN
jgi:Tol biopolymer transport system component